MSLLTNQWRRWRRSLLLVENMSVVPWLFLVLATVVNGQFPPPPHNMHNHQPPPGPPGPPQQGMNMNMNAQPFATGPTAQSPNFYYSIDPSQGSNRLVQRQMQPGPSGINAAATNYLLQQLQNERQQQQLQHRSMGPGPQQMSPQQQALQLLGNLSPQQLSALQQVIPTLPRGGGLTPGPHDEHSGRVPMSAFASRIGPFDKLFSRAKSWLPDMMSAGSSQQKQGGGGGGSGGDGVGEPRMRDLHRLPKPPQYPLYDLPSIGQATPPPAPIMHPMASLPNSAFDLDQPQMQSSSPRSTGPMPSGSSFNQQNWMSSGPTMATARRSRPGPTQRPPKPSRPSFLRNPLGRSHKKPRPSPDPPANYNRRNHGPPPKGRQPPPQRTRGRTPPITTRPKKMGPPRGRGPPAGGRRPPPSSNGPSSDPYGTSGPGGNQGFEHPMASNLSPAQSPALGRPLSYDEYMARPSHSYTNDPWNFDPFANQMNQGLHTGSLRYNYDPLGMNALDTEANSHLDPNKLSYPGDSFNQDMVKDSPGIGATGQIGGWDKPYKKRPYDSDPEGDLTPPGVAYGGGSPPSFPSSSNDPFGSIPSSMGSSSNRYKNSGSNHNSGNNNGPSGGTGFLGDAMSGGRLGEMPSTLDQFEGGSSIPGYNDAPTIDLESLQQSQGDDGMDGLEFTIETSPDQGPQGMGSTMMMDDSPNPDHHPLGPMQPAANPYLSDQYNPYGEQSSPSQSNIPGTPYGPGGYRERERYGRRRTRNHGPPPPMARRRSLKTPRPRMRKLIPHPPPPHSTQMPSIPSPTAIVPEGVQIFNEIIRPQIVQSNAPRHHHHHHARHLPPPQQAALRRSLYNAIRHSSRK